MRNDQNQVNCPVICLRIPLRRCYRNSKIPPRLERDLRFPSQKMLRARPFQIPGISPSTDLRLFNRRKDFLPVPWVHSALFLLRLLPNPFPHHPQPFVAHFHSWINFSLQPFETVPVLLRALPLLFPFPHRNDCLNGREQPSSGSKRLEQFKISHGGIQNAKLKTNKNYHYILNKDCRILRNSIGSSLQLKGDIRLSVNFEPNSPDM